MQSPAPLRSWDKICRPKYKRILGISKAEHVNLALIQVRMESVIRIENIWFRVAISK